MGNSKPGRGIRKLRGLGVPKPRRRASPCIWAVVLLTIWISSISKQAQGLGPRVGIPTAVLNLHFEARRLDFGTPNPLSLWIPRPGLEFPKSREAQAQDCDTHTELQCCSLLLECTRGNNSVFQLAGNIVVLKVDRIFSNPS